MMERTLEDWIEAVMAADTKNKVQGLLRELDAAEMPEIERVAILTSLVEAEKRVKLPAIFQPVALRYDASIVQFCLSTEMAKEAVQMVARGIAKGTRRDLEILAHEFNQIANSYMEQMGWEGWYVDEVKQAMEVAMAVSSKPNLILVQ